MASQRRLSLDLLKGFEAAARHRSFTRAAGELSLTQGAVSREVKSLEEQLGQPLFVRVHRGIVLTESGEQLLRAVTEALALIDEVTDRLAAYRAAEPLKVTTSAPLASTWLVPKLSAFFRQRPDVDVRCMSADKTLDLERERLDLAIRWAPDGQTVLGGTKLFDLKRFPVCAPSLLADARRPLREPMDLARHVLLDLETTTGQGRWTDWAPWLEAMGMKALRPARVMRFTHFDQVLQSAVDGNGVAMGRFPHSVRQLREGKLVAPLGPAATRSWGAYYLLASSRSVGRPVVQDFIAWLRDEATRDAATLPRLLTAPNGERSPLSATERARASRGPDRLVASSTGKSAA